MNTNSHAIPYEILLERYNESQLEIEYLNYKISSLNEELDLWQKAYEDQLDILVENDLI